MSEKNKSDILRNLAAAKAEAKEKMHELSDNALAQVVGGKCWEGGWCPHCGHLVVADSSTICPYCGAEMSPGEGDERDMDEALADIDGLMADVDGFAE